MKKLTPDADLRRHLISLLESGNAHITFNDAVNEFPIELAGNRPNNSPHSAWELLEHLRIAQEDIIAFCESSNYVQPNWPDDYWPRSPAPHSASAWSDCVASIRNDLARFIKLLNDESRDLFEPLPWGNGQTLLREALLIADHNSYHLGQLMLVRRMLEQERTEG